MEQSERVVRWGACGLCDGSLLKNFKLKSDLGHDHDRSCVSVAFSDLVWRPRAQRTAVSTSSVSHHEFGKCVRLSAAMQSSELTYLPVERLHLRAQSLAAKFEEAGGH